ncbi:MAG: polymerase [Variovorax sp.]|nr:MAG: polymerase [Variovorax sp.]
MQRSSIVRPAAMFWGLAVFSPVGVNYLAAVLLLLCMVIAGVAGDWRERVARLRASPIFWPVVAYLAWTLVVLALRPHYPQTGSNLWHGFRIGATMLMAMALTRDEALWALRGFLAMALASVAMVLLYRSVGFPMTELWRATLILVGNKSINNALLFTVLGASAAVYGLAHLRNAHGQLGWQALAAFALTGATAVIVTLWLPSRTSLLAMLIAVVAACVHQWRKRLGVLAGVLLLAGVIVAALVWQAPSVQQKFELGLQEIEAAQAGAVSEGSWVVRFYMYRDTARMIIDQPLAGWGIGGWTEQWHLRGPKLLADYNMPHNDFLWMGAQAGLPGALLLLSILLVGLWHCWRRDDLAGRYGFAAMLVMLVATSVNSAMRDAQIGLSLLWVAMVYLRIALVPGAVWQDVVPRRNAPALVRGG